MRQEIHVLTETDFHRSERTRTARRRTLLVALALVVIVALAATAWALFRPARYLPRPAYLVVFHGNHSVRVEPGDADFRPLWMALDGRVPTPVGFAPLLVQQGDVLKLKAEQTVVELCYDEDVALEFRWNQSVERREGIRYLLAPLTGEHAELLYIAGTDGDYRSGPIGMLKDPQAMLDKADRSFARLSAEGR